MQLTSTIGLVPLHATPGDQPSPLTPIRLLTAWNWDWWIVAGVLIAAGLYVWGLAVLRRRGDRWPVGRTLAYLVGGLGSLVVATLSALGTYDTVLISIHMVQHMILAMMTPMFLALGAPMTLALRTLPAGPRKILLTVLHSRVARVLTFPPLTLALFVATPFALYFSGIYPITLESAFWHNFMHLHFIVIGSMFMWPMVGVDPLPGRVSHPMRLLMLFLTLPFHAFLGISIMSSDALIAEDWYLAFNRTWGASPVEDQYLAGGILWGSGDLIAVIMMGVLFAQWFKASQREAAQVDRRLDLMEARAARADRARYDQAASPKTEDRPS